MNLIRKQVEYVSPIMARSGIKFTSKKWQFQIQESYNSAQFADATNAVFPSGDAVIGEIPAYMFFDFSGRWQATKSISLEIEVNNSRTRNISRAELRHIQGLEFHLRKGSMDI